MHRILSAAAISAGLCLYVLPGTAAAQAAQPAWPSKPIRVIVPNPAGGEAGFMGGAEFMKGEGVRWTRFVEAAKKNAR